eukprot:tig00000237_g20475.t1
MAASFVGLALGPNQLRQQLRSLGTSVAVCRRAERSLHSAGQRPAVIVFFATACSARPSEDPDHAFRRGFAAGVAARKAKQVGGVVARKKEIAVVGAEGDSLTYDHMTWGDWLKSLGELSSEEIAKRATELFESAGVQGDARPVVFFAHDGTLEEAELEALAERLRAGVEAAGAVHSKRGVLTVPMMKHAVRAANRGDLPDEIELLGSLARSYVGAMTVGGGVDFLPKPLTVECASPAGTAFLRALNSMIQDYMPVSPVESLEDPAALAAAARPAKREGLPWGANVLKGDAAAPDASKLLKRVARTTECMSGVTYGALEEGAEAAARALTELDGYAIAALLGRFFSDLVAEAGFGPAQVVLVVLGAEEGGVDLDGATAGSSIPVLPVPVGDLLDVVQAIHPDEPGRIIVFYDRQGRGGVLYGEGVKGALQPLAEEAAAPAQQGEAPRSDAERPRRRVALERLVQLSELAVGSASCADALHTMALVETALACRGWTMDEWLAFQRDDALRFAWGLPEGVLASKEAVVQLPEFDPAALGLTSFPEDFERE